MKKILNVLKTSILFKGVNEEDLSSMLTCLNATVKTYEKGSYLFNAGDKINKIAILVEGKLYIQKDDFWGNRSIINEINVSDMFGEAYAGSINNIIVNDVIAVLDSTVIYLDVHKILTVCTSSCTFHTKVIANLFTTISEKNKNLVQKLGYMACRTTREKLLAYLSDQSKKAGQNNFVIPFNRQQLADYLSVDRSAMSNELSKMRDEGLIEFNKNYFNLKE